MAWRDCKGVVVACAAWAGIPTCCLGTFGDMLALAQDPAGPLFWAVNALVGFGGGAATGLLVFALVRPNTTREALSEAADVMGAKVVDEWRAVRTLRYLIGVPLALSEAAVWLFYLSETVARAMR